MINYDTNVTCTDCHLAWNMTKGYGNGIFCPYCGKEQKPPSVDFLYTRDKMNSELEAYRINGVYHSVTDDHSYWWGYIDALSKKHLITTIEEKELVNIRKEFKQYCRG